MPRDALAANNSQPLPRAALLESHRRVWNLACPNGNRHAAQPARQPDLDDQEDLAFLGVAVESHAAQVRPSVHVALEGLG